MNNYDRVVWSEGLLLQPHLFQQQERHLEHKIEARCSAVRAYSWGFKRIALDQKALDLGKISIQEASGIFPDGTPFDMPNLDLIPSAIEIGDDNRGQTVYLAIPLVSAGSLLASQNATQKLTRFQISDTEVYDHNSEEFTSEILELGKLNSHIICGKDKLHGFAYLPIAKVIEQSTDGSIKLDKRFIPPIIHSSASAVLENLLDQVIGITTQRADSISQSFGDGKVSSTSSVSEFLMLQLLNRYEAILQHIQLQKNTHPEVVYRELVKFAAELSTFTRAAKRPDVLPVYNHAEPNDCFPPLFESINQALTTVSEQRAVPLPVEEKRFGIRTVRSNDQKVFVNGRFVMAIKADLSPDEIMRIFPKQLKIAPIQRISEFVNNQLPGIGIKPLASAPREIPYHSGFSYFAINTQSEYWPEIAKSASFAFHIAGEYPGLTMELWAIREVS